MRVVPALMLLLALSACSKGDKISQTPPDNGFADAPRRDMPEARLESGLSRPVTIGEDGPRLDACGALGQVTRPGGAGLAVRAAPFDDAREIARLAEGDRAFVCTRSLDQKWLGVIVPPAPAPAADNAAEPVDCGVSSPVERQVAYDGPCVSGWVASAYIRLIAG